MKIAIAGNYSRNLAIFRGPLIGALVSRGHSVVAIGPEEDFWTQGRIAALGARFICIPMARASINPVLDLLYLFRMRNLVRRESPDVMLTFSHKPNIYGTLAASLSGSTRVVVLIEGLGYSFIEISSIRKRISNWIVKSLYRLVLRKCSRALFVNPRDIEMFRSEKLLPAGFRADLIDGIGVDLDRFRFHPIPSGPVKFLMIARLLRTKGLMEYCAAAREVKRLYPEVCFWLVGAEDPSSDRVPAAELREYTESGVIEWKGETNDVVPFYRDCSVYVLPSYREGMPVTIMEAMAVGRPILATNVPGCNLAVKDGVNGFLVEPRNPRELALAMGRFIEEPRTMQSMGAMSRRIAEERFDVRRINEIQVGILERAGGKGMEAR